MANYSGTVVCASCKKITPRDYSKCQVCGAPLLVFENTDPHKTAGQIEADALGANCPTRTVAPVPLQTQGQAAPRNKNANWGVAYLLIGGLSIIVGIIGGSTGSLDTKEMPLTDPHGPPIISEMGTFFVFGTASLIVGAWMVAKRK